MSLAKNWCFTLNNFTEEELIFFKSLIHRPEISYVVFQGEAGENNTNHLQGYVQLEKKKRLAFLKNNISNRAHFEVARGTAEQNYTYCTKEETRTHGPYEFGEITAPGKRNDIIALKEAIEDNPYISLNDLVKDHCVAIAKYPNFIMTLRNMYTTPPPASLVPRNAWQNQLAISLEGDPSPREVKWFSDEIGGTGKSYFARNYVGPDGRRGYIVSGGKHADVIYGYQKERVVFFNFTREVIDRVPYGLMEGFKDGYLFSSKYNSHSLYFKTPHVVIFANFMPDESKLSQDRWNIINIY